MFAVGAARSGRASVSQTQSDDDLIAELLPSFIDEANQQVAAFEQLLLELEDAPTDHALLDALFRCAHTVKGSAGVFGLGKVVEFTHHVESVLDRLREGALQLSPPLSTLLLQCNDAIRDLVASVHGAGDSEDAAHKRVQLTEKLKAHLGLPVAGAPSPHGHCDAAVVSDVAVACRTYRIAARFGADTFRHGMDPLAIVTYLGRFGRTTGVRCELAAVPALDDIDPESCHLKLEFDFHTELTQAKVEEAFSFVKDESQIVVEERLTLPVESGPSQGPSAVVTPTAEALANPIDRTPQSVVAPKSREATGATGADETAYIRVLANRLDEVINLLGELVIAGAGASTLAQVSQQRALIEANRQVSRLIEGIRNSTLKLRMVPIGETFSRFRRVVRDTAAELGKDVALEILGGETELDKAMVERIADPLMHLVRNSLDHGLESAEQRQAAGKSPQGRLTLAACHESGSILIRISDDGRGIQREKVLRRARERGLVEPGVTPTDEQILNFIFAAGFSTAEQVTNLSGRGVGMDVVRRNIEALRGTVAVLSTEGQGSSIEIRLPLTLAIIDGFLVGVGNSRFIFPLECVVEVIASHVANVCVDERGRGCVDLRGRLLPVVDFRSLYGLHTPAPERVSVVVVGVGSRRYGVVVDSLLGQHQTVIKPLGRMLCSLRGISGSSILGSGEVALIVDADALGRIAEKAPSGLPAALSSRVITQG